MRALHDGALLRALGDDFARLAPASSAWACSATSGRACARPRAARATGSTWSHGSATSREPRRARRRARAARPGSSTTSCPTLPDAQHGALPRAGSRTIFAPAFAQLGWKPRLGPRPTTARQRARRAARDARRTWPKTPRRARGRRGAHRSLSEGPPHARAEPGGTRGRPRRAARRRRALRRATCARWKRARTPQERTRFEMALGAFRDPALVERALALTLSRRDPDAGRGAAARAACSRTPRRASATWEFIRERWTELAPRVSPGLASRLVSALPALQKPLYRRQVASFFATHPLPTASRALKQALERFDLDAELRERASCPSFAATCAATERSPWICSEDLLARPFAAVREACAEVAASRAQRRDRSGTRSRASPTTLPLGELGASPTSFPALGGDVEGARGVRASVSTRSTSAPAGSRSSPSARDTRATARSRPRCASASSARARSRARELRGDRRARRRGAARPGARSRRRSPS